MTKKQRLYFQILGLILILVMVIRPMAVRLADNLNTRRQLLKRWNGLQAKIDTLAGIDPVVIDERVKKMEAVFPSVKPIVPLLATLSHLASEQGLSFGGLSLSPGTLNSPTGLNDLPFGFSVGGSFDQISRFLQSLENTAPLMKIEEVGLTIKTNPFPGREATQVVADIKVSAYYQAPPQSIGKVDQPVKLLSRSEEVLLNQLVSFKTFPPILPQGVTGKENLFQ